MTLREVMLQAMGEDTRADPSWMADARAWFAQTLSVPRRCAAFVVEDEHGVLISSAVGLIYEHAPSSRYRTGLHGRISNVATLPAHRRQGHALACVVALLAWYDAETAVRVIDLNATDDGIGMDLALGFVEPSGLGLRRKRS